MGDDGFVAVLFYADGADPTMGTGGRMTGRGSLVSKIFWWVPGGGNDLVIHGRERATGRVFTQAVSGIGGGQFPSVPVVPAAGCWTLTETVGGRTVGAVTLPVSASA